MTDFVEPPPVEERSQTRTLVRHDDFDEEDDDRDVVTVENPAKDDLPETGIERPKEFGEQVDEGSESTAPSRAMTDPASMMRDSGFSDATGGSRNFTPDVDMDGGYSHEDDRRLRNLFGGASTGLLQTITDSLEDDQDEEDQERQIRDVDRKRHPAVRLHEKPQLISTDIGANFMMPTGDRFSQSDPMDLQYQRNRQFSNVAFNEGDEDVVAGRMVNRRGSDGAREQVYYDQRPKTSGDLPAASITHAVQNSLRKYQMERKIFEELLELKRLQIRVGRSNEQALVKRLSDSYAKCLREMIGLRTYDGPFTFKDFEKYLFNQLRQLQLPQARLLPKHLLRHSDEIDRLSQALRRHGIDCSVFDPIPSYPSSRSDAQASVCTHSTHRCHHATHAYAGMPYMQYKKPKSKSVMLPKIENGRSQLVTTLGARKLSGDQLHSSQAPLDPKHPLTLELQHAGQRHTVSLPTETLDKTKKYYVTFTINSSTKKMLSPIELPHQDLPPEVAVPQG